VYKALADPAHPFAKFTTGNKATLGQNGTLGLLRELYHRCYARGPAPALRGGGAGEGSGCATTTHKDCSHPRTKKMSSKAWRQDKVPPHTK